jgi:hypothetical protein
VIQNVTLNPNRNCRDRPIAQLASVDRIFPKFALLTLPFGLLK